MVIDNFLQLQDIWSLFPPKIVILIYFSHMFLLEITHKNIQNSKLFFMQLCNYIY